MEAKESDLEILLQNTIRDLAELGITFQTRSGSLWITDRRTGIATTKPVRDLIEAHRERFVKESIRRTRSTTRER